LRIFAVDRARTIWIALGIAILAGIWIGSLMPIERLPRVGGGDKLHHFVAYAACGFWWCMLAATWRARIGWIVGLALMGVVIELLQGASGFRHFELADMVANATGAVIGGVLASLIPLRSIQAPHSP
jgi:VanZ family protein